jgi:hypothetical protein
MKLWIDDVRPAPEGYLWCKSTRDALRKIVLEYPNEIDFIDLDHDAGDYAKDGGDFIGVLKELERLSRRHKMDFSQVKFRLHSANPVGVQNMRAIIEANGWKEIR